MMRKALLLGVVWMMGCEWYPPQPRLEGAWRFRFDDMSDGELLCAIPAMDITITQSGSTFAGVQSGGAVRRCYHLDGDSAVVSFTDATLTGTIGRVSIGFNFARTPGSGVAWSSNSQSGTVSGNIILGQASWAGSKERPLDGTFAAFRLPE